jgi:hypothetical protein
LTLKINALWFFECEYLPADTMKHSTIIFIRVRHCYTDPQD